jgi:hypothetical protein
MLASLVYYTDRERERETDRQTERQRDRETDTLGICLYDVRAGVEEGIHIYNIYTYITYIYYTHRHLRPARRTSRHCCLTASLARHTAAAAPPTATQKWHTSAYVRTRQHTSTYVSMRPHTCSSSRSNTEVASQLFLLHAVTKDSSTRGRKVCSSVHITCIDSIRRFNTPVYVCVCVV